MLCCGYTLTDFPMSIRLTSLALWQSNDCPSASKATLMNMDKYFMWIHYERLHNHNKAKHNKTVCIFLGIYCMMCGFHNHVAPFEDEYNGTILMTHFVFLTQWGRDKMDAISQTIFWSAFSWMKMFEFRLKFHWSLFLRVQLTIFQLGLDNGLAPIRRQAIIWTNGC